MGKYSKSAFQDEVRKMAAEQAGIPVGAVRDDTPVNPGALTLLLTLRLCVGVVCENMQESTTFGGAKRHIVPLFP